MLTPQSSLMVLLQMKIRASAEGQKFAKSLTQIASELFAGINHALIEINGENFSLDQPGINALVWNTEEGIVHRLLFS